MPASKLNASPVATSYGSPPVAPPSSALPVATATIYTCPIHPILRHSGPRHCPICGMSFDVFVPMVGGEEVDSELLATTRRLWVSIALPLPLLLMARHLAWVVIEGHTTIDESMISGEPVPSAKSAGSPVTGATVNQMGSFTDAR